MPSPALIIRNIFLQGKAPQEVEDNIQNVSALKIQFERMSQIIEQDLSDTSKEQLTKVMGSTYKSIQRRTNGSREYIAFAQQYVGTRVGPGARIFRDKSGN
jgi:hypothetical protein